MATASDSVVRPPAARARRMALGLSAVAVLFSLPCGFCGRQAYALRSAPEVALPWLLAFLIFLLVALLVRGAAAVAELIWLERTWSNLPDGRRKVGPIQDVSAALALALHLVPGVAWLWKLGIVLAIADGFETYRPRFTAPIPRTLGKVAVVVGWVPGLNVYLAPFLWEAFARGIDACVRQILTCAERT